MATGEHRSDGSGSSAFFWIVLAIILFIMLGTCAGLAILISSIVYTTEAQFKTVVAEAEASIQKEEEAAQAMRLARLEAWEEGEKKAQEFLEALSKEQWEAARQLGTSEFQSRMTVEDLQALVAKHPFLRGSRVPGDHPIFDPSSAGPMEYRFVLKPTEPGKSGGTCTVIMRNVSPGAGKEVRVESVEASSD